MKEAFCIGVSGHQNLGDNKTISFIGEKFRGLLLTYQAWAQQHERELKVYAALARGADQLFIEIALELGISAEVVIPCALYEQIFTSPESLAKYNELLSKCQDVHPLSFNECTEDAFLAAGHWVVDHSDLVLLAWNGYPAVGKGGTADVAAYARRLRKPFIHIHTRLHTTKMYGSLEDAKSKSYGTPLREYEIAKQTVYQGSVLSVNQYKFRMPDGEEIEREIVERPESVLILPVGQKDTVLLIEEYDLGAGAWLLTIPGGKVVDSASECIYKQAEQELREEIGYRPGRLEKLLSFYSHPGYIGHHVHLFVAHDLEWDPLEMEDGEDIKVQTFTLSEALDATKQDYRFDSEAALALWLYMGKMHIEVLG